MNRRRTWVVFGPWVACCKPMTNPASNERQSPRAWKSVYLSKNIPTEVALCLQYGRRKTIFFTKKTKQALKVNLWEWLKDCIDKIWASKMSSFATSMVLKALQCQSGKYSSQWFKTNLGQLDLSSVHIQSIFTPPLSMIYKPHPFH